MTGREIFATHQGLYQGVPYPNPWWLPNIGSPVGKNYGSALHLNFQQDTGSK